MIKLVEQVPRIDGISRTATLLAGLTIYSVTYLQKLAIPGTGRTIWLSQALLLFVFTVSFFKEYFVLASTNIIVCYFLLLSVDVLTIALKVNQNLSSGSFALLVLFHGLYLVRFRDGLVTSETVEQIFRRVCLVLAVFGIVQFALQFIVGRQLAFFIDYFVPSEFLIAGYNNLNQLEYGSSILKANAFVLIEPASLNQLLSVGLILNLLRDGKLWHTVTLIFGLIVTFSGTGLLVVLAIAPFILISRGRFLTILGAVVLIPFIIYFGDELGLRIFISRSSELSAPGSSGYARFISGGLLLKDYIINDGPALFFGRGPGTVREHAQEYGFEIFTPTIIRMIYEYGFIGGGLYIVFMTVVIWRPNIPPTMKSTIWLTFMMMSDYSLVPMMHGLVLALIAWPSSENPSTAT